MISYGILTLIRIPRALVHLVLGYSCPVKSVKRIKSINCSSWFQYRLVLMRLSVHHSLWRQNGTGPRNGNLRWYLSQLAEAVVEMLIDGHYCNLHKWISFSPLKRLPASICIISMIASSLSSATRRMRDAIETQRTPWERRLFTDPIEADRGSRLLGGALESPLQKLQNPDQRSLREIIWREITEEIIERETIEMEINFRHYFSCEREHRKIDVSSGSN